jgi:hypothetical protein
MSRGARLAALAASLATAAPGAFAAEPRSAIPWLSESLAAAPTPDPPRPAPRVPAPDDGIVVTALGDISQDAVGLVPPERSGFPPALWGPAPADAVRAAILGHPGEGVPAARGLFHRILIAEADPPAGGSQGALLVARIDRLMQIGALEDAGALIERAGPDTPELFRRWFDIGILLDRTKAPCSALRDNPGLSPTLPARVFCLARGGDWNAAEITLTLGGEVGGLAEEQERMLAWFLDPVLFEGEPPPPVPEPLTPLDFFMREAVGLPRPPGPLPDAFLHLDLAEYAPVRFRINAGERLVGAGAVPAERLFEAYRAGEPAASGGVWERAAAVQDVDAALADGDTVAIGPALVAADVALTARGLRTALAEEYGAALAGLDAGALTEEAQAPLIELLLLAGETDAAAAAAGPEPTARHRVLLALAGAGGASLGEAAETAGSDHERAALDGLQAIMPSDAREERLAAMLRERRVGETLLAALDLVSAGTETDPQALRSAIYILRRAGLTADARRIALETLLLGEAEAE